MVKEARERCEVLARLTEVVRALERFAHKREELRKAMRLQQTIHLDRAGRLDRLRRLDRWWRARTTTRLSHAG